jgi:TRAP-type C4-dicarboxylate transport system permease small subunit
MKFKYYALLTLSILIMVACAGFLIYAGVMQINTQMNADGAVYNWRTIWTWREWVVPVAIGGLVGGFCLMEDVIN